MSLVKVHSTADMHIFTSKFTCCIYCTYICVYALKYRPQSMLCIALLFIPIICLHCDISIRLDLIPQDTRNILAKQISCLVSLFMNIDCYISRCDNIYIYIYMCLSWQFVIAVLAEQTSECISMV